MSNCIENLPHKCGSSDGLQVFEEDGVITGYCFPCGTYVPDPYEDQPKDYVPKKLSKSPEEIANELFEIWECPTVDISERMLSKEALEYYGVKVGLSQSDGSSPEQLFFPYVINGETVAYKAKLLPVKKGWWIGKAKGVEPFGWMQAQSSGNQKLIIVEGEADAVALWQMITRHQKGTEWEGWFPAVISITHGASSAVKGLLEIASLAESLFKDIIIAFDMDEAGQTAAQAVVKDVFPNAKIAHLPANDPNACLLEGRSKACIKAVMWNSIVPKSSSVRSVHDLAEEAKNPPQWGWSYPWGGLTELTRGIRKGEVITLAAAVKMGKSHTAKQIAAHLIMEHGVKTILASPEESAANALKGMVGVVAEKVFNDPKVAFDGDAFDRGLELLDEKLFIVDSNQTLGWDSLKNDIKYAIIANGCELVVIDPLSNLIAMLGTAEANEFLNQFMPEIAKIALEYDVAVILTSHLKASESGAGHEEGNKVLLKELTGGRAIIRSSNLLLGLEGDLSNEDKDIRKMRKLRIMADRNLGATGTIDLWWNENVHKLEEVVL